MDETLRDNIRRNLIRCRTDFNMTQSDLGKIIGKSKTAVASWEQGLSLPDVTTLYKLSKLYGKTMEFFYE